MFLSFTTFSTIIFEPIIIGAGEIIDFVLLIVTSFGFSLAFIQWRKNERLSRCSYVKELIDKTDFDKDVSEVFFKIDYGEQWYSQKFHNTHSDSDSDFEKKMDKTLSSYSFICYLFLNNVLTEKDSSFFKYKLCRILTNEQVQDYLFNLYHWSRRNEENMPFNYLLVYGKKYHYFKQDFWDSKAYEKNQKFHHYLNF